MKTFTLAAPLGALAVLALSVSAGDLRSQRFQPVGTPESENSAAGALATDPVTEAPTGFDALTNGFDVQGPAFDTIDEDTVVALRSFNDNRFIFEEQEL